MKKIIALFSLILIVNLTITKAQSPSGTTPSPEVKKEALSDQTKQCHGKTSAASHCVQPSKGESSTLSDNHRNSGSVAATETISNTSKKEGKSSCASDATKACCKSNSRAAVFSKNNKTVKETSETPAPNPQQ